MSAVDSPYNGLGADHERTSVSMIAVVDDADSVRKAMIQLLQIAGYVARGFVSGEEFLQTWPCSKTRCVILDLEMPGLSGVDVQRALNLARASVPVIVMTAHDSIAVREECTRLGALVFLSKPVDISCLLNAVAMALQRSSLVEVVGQTK
jgi:FixJ family two-component response regulator